MGTTPRCGDRLRGRTVFLLVCAGAVMALAACASPDSSDNGSGSDSGGNPGPTCNTEECQDSYTAYGIVDSVWTVYNANIAAHSQPPSGFDGTAACQSGGDVDYQGTVTPGDPVSSIDTMVYTFRACRHVDSDYDLTLDGTLTQSGTYTSGGPVLSMGFISSALTMTGTVADSFDPADIAADACMIGITSTADGTSGTVCGRSFSY